MTKKFKLPAHCRHPAPITVDNDDNSTVNLASLVYSLSTHLFKILSRNTSHFSETYTSRLQVQVQLILVAHAGSNSISKTRYDEKKMTKCRPFFPLFLADKENIPKNRIRKSKPWNRNEDRNDMPIRVQGADDRDVMLMISNNLNG